MRYLIQTILFAIDIILLVISFGFIRTGFGYKYTQWVLDREREKMDEDARRR